MYYRPSGIVYVAYLTHQPSRASLSLMVLHLILPHFGKC